MTILFFNIPAHGHTYPTLPLVSELVGRGARVIYYSIRSFRVRIEATGAEFRPYPFDGELEPENNVIAPFKAMPHILALGEQVIENALDAARADNPDVIIYDSMAPWGKQIAQILKRPAICSCSIFFVGAKNFAALPRDATVSNQVLLRLPVVFRWFAEYFRVAFLIRLKWGASSPMILDFFGNPGDLTLVYTSRYFQTGARWLDDSFRFVGPLLAPRRDHADFPFAWLDGAPLIYVSLGTIFNDRADFYRLCIEALRDTPYRVVLSIGNKVNLASLGALPENILVRPHVPQLHLLERASLFITHGGMNSVSESAWYGVPMLLAPQVGDQHVIARRVAQLGAGVLLDEKKLNAPTLREIAERVLRDDSFRQESERIGKSLRDAGGATRAADEIMRFLQPRTLSPARDISSDASHKTEISPGGTPFGRNQPF